MRAHAAALASLLLACGASDGDLPDARRAAPDAGSPTTVRVRLGGLPVAGAIVSVVEGDAAPTSTATDAAGDALVMVTASAAITVIVDQGGSAMLVSALDVTPGEALTFAIPVPTPPTIAVTITGTSPGGGPIELCDGGGNASIPGNGTPTAVTLPARFATTATPLIGIEVGAGAPTLGTLAAQTFTDGGSATLPAPGTWTPMPTIDIEATGLPAEVTATELGVATLRDGAVLCESRLVAVMPAAGTAALAATYAPGGDGFRITATAIAGGSIQDLHTHTTSAPALVTVDGARLAPWLNAPTVTTAPLAWTWTETASGGSAVVDGAIALASYRTAAGAVTWLLVAPPGGTSIAAPALPATASAWSPDGATFEGAVMLLAALAAAEGAAAFRALLLADLQLLFGGGDARAWGDYTISRIVG